MTVSMPEVLLLLPLCLGLLALGSFLASRRSRRLENYLATEPKGGFWPGAPQKAVSIHHWVTKGVLFVAAGAFMLVSVSGLRIGTRDIPTFRTEAPLILLLDVSQSMAVEDVAWSRLGAARLFVRRMAGKLPGATMALTVFARDAYPLLPPGPDRDLLFSYLDAVGPDMVTNQGTALEPALREAARFAEDWEGESPPVFLLMTDGEDPSGEGEILDAARAIREAGGVLATVAFGTETGGVVPVPVADPRLYGGSSSPGDQENTRPFSKANPQLLSTLAELGEGRFADAQDAGEINELLTWLGPALGEADGPETIEAGVDRWPWLVTLALLALLLEASLLGPGQRRRNHPWP